MCLFNLVNFATNNFFPSSENIATDVYQCYNASSFDEFIKYQKYLPNVYKHVKFLLTGSHTLTQVFKFQCLNGRRRSYYDPIKNFHF